MRISKLRAALPDGAGLPRDVRSGHLVSGVRSTAVAANGNTLRLVLPILLMLAVISLQACADPNAAKRRALTADIERLGTDYSRLSQSVAAKAASVADVERRLAAQQSELSDYKRQVSAFMMDHKMAVAALAVGAGGAVVALDADNAFTDDAQAVGGIAALFAAAYAVGNADEVASVADRLFQADRFVKTLEEQISETTAASGALSQELSQAQGALRDLGATLDRTHAEFDALQ